MSEPAGPVLVSALRRGGLAVAGLAGALLFLAIGRVAWQIAQLSPEDPATGTLVSQAQLLVAVVQLVLAVALTAATISYVRKTGAMVTEMREGRLEQTRQWTEDREADRERPSREAAIRLLRSIRDADLRSTDTDAEWRRRALDLTARVEADVGLLRREQLLVRVVAFYEVLRVSTFDSAQFADHEGGWPMVRLRLIGQILLATVATLENYITGRELPDWEELPTETEAFAWAHGPGATPPS